MTRVDDAGLRRFLESCGAAARCSNCARSGLLLRTSRGWLCSACVGAIVAEEEADELAQLPFDTITRPAMWEAIIIVTCAGRREDHHRSVLGLSHDDAEQEARERVASFETLTNTVQLLRLAAYGLLLRSDLGMPGEIDVDMPGTWVLDFVVHGCDGHGFSGRCWPYGRTLECARRGVAADLEVGADELYIVGARRQEGEGNDTNSGTDTL